MEIIKRKKDIKEMTKKVVWRYQIPVKDYSLIEMPFGAEILHFGLQYGKLKLWVLVDPSIEEMVERRFRLAGTGYDITEGGLQYIGTVKVMNGVIIYHLFEY